MEYFKNKAEKFFREIRSIQIYASANISFVNNYNGIFPVLEAPDYKFDIVPENYSRKISTKTANGNYYYEVDITFPLLDLSKPTVGKCLQNFNRKAFSVVLISNTEKMLLGNNREPLKVEIIDNKTDDNSGNDYFTIAISGETIIPPKTQNI